MKYQIFITKSAKVASLLAKAHRCENNGGISGVAYGLCDNYTVVPPMYYGKYLFACVVEYTDEARVSDYELILA